LAGMAGTVGFPIVSERAAELERLAAQADRGFSLDVARGELEALRETFVREIASPPSWAAPQSAEGQAGIRILVVDDADDQRQLVTDYLRLAGHDPLPLAAGDVVLDAARAHNPRLIVLDANLPGLDGYSVCRLLKSDPDLASIPVVFMTVRSSLDDKLAGLMLGADEYLVKPVDMRELLMRIELLLRKPRSSATAAPSAQRGQLLNYDLFVGASRELLKQSGATFVLMRAMETDVEETVIALRSAVRQRDIVSRYDRTHVVLLLGGAPPALVRHRIADLVKRLRERGLRGVWAGIAFSTVPGDKTVETLLAEADDALAAARQGDEAVAVAGDRPQTGAPVKGASVLVASENLELVRTIELGMRTAGYELMTAASGDEALRLAVERQPDVLLIGLTIPGLPACDVLARLAQDCERFPRVVALAPRGREADVTRAFEMGAADYVSVPFSASELLARVARLLR
jgi:DNA-binding response OmpR family regulator